ncbi:ABC transporter ATP-binding protein [Clostridiaceae bacterium 35-E11]
MIDIQELTVKYPTEDGEITALENINMQLATGEICAVIGPSGSGKSTLLKVLAGIIKDYTGTILVNHCSLDARIQRIGFIPQEYGLLDWKSVYDNALLSLKIKDKKKKQNQLHIDKVIRQLGLESLKLRYPYQLSGGQRQRVAIARAFILSPNLLLMDESFSALDAITREEIQDIFLDVWKENQVTTILVTHSITEAIYLGNKIAIFSKSPGKLVKMMDNPLFGIENLREKEEYYQLNIQLRKMLKEEW